MDTLVGGAKIPSTYLISSIRIEGLQVLRSFINQSLLPVAMGVSTSLPHRGTQPQKYDNWFPLNKALSNPYFLKGEG